MDSNDDAALCSVCYGLYDDPRSLPCGHSFCLKCISRVADLGRKFLCPSCRNDVKLDYRGVKGLPKNYGLGYIIEGHKKMSSALCSEHKKSLDMFCEQCDVMICSKCLFSSHSGHKIQETDDVFNKRKGRLTELLESTKPWQAQIKEKTDEIRSLRQSVKKAAEAIKAKIDDTFGRWSDDLEKQRQTLQRHVDEETEQRMKVFDDHLIVLDSANIDISNLQTEMNTTLSKDTTSVVQLCGSVEESHKTVGMKAKNVMETSFAPPPDLEIDISAPWMEEAIQNIKPIDTGQGQITSVARGISMILEENENLQSDVRRLQFQINEYQFTMKDSKRRENEKSDQLEDERKKNHELTDKLENEKRGQELKKAELRKHVDKLMETIIQTSLDQFELFKKSLEDKENSLLRPKAKDTESDNIDKGLAEGEINSPTWGKSPPKRRTKKKFALQQLYGSAETVRPSASSGGRDDYWSLDTSDSEIATSLSGNREPETNRLVSKPTTCTLVPYGRKSIEEEKDVSGNTEPEENIPLSKTAPCKRIPSERLSQGITGQYTQENVNDTDLPKSPNKNGVNSPKRNGANSSKGNILQQHEKLNVIFPTKSNDSFA